MIKILENAFFWGILSDGLIDGDRVDPAKVRPVAEHNRVDPDALLAAAQRRLDGQSETPNVTDEETYRRAEYEAFIDGRGDANSDLLVDVVEGSEYQGGLDRFVRRVCLVRKLKETRAMVGLSRILPAQGRTDDRLQPLSKNMVGWLPAVVVRGEGIFFEFDKEALDNWVDREEGAKARAAGLEAAYNARRLERGLEIVSVSPKFLLLHTMAHLMIKQLSFDCGYGSASLRERLYCDSDDGAHPMQGLLIYTASGDSEGTLGGLVRQGEPGRLEPVFAEAVRSGSWCSSDPVCIESPGQGTENSNLAACHGCALLSETSCEEGNRLLDRAVVVGTMTQRSIGFLSPLLASEGATT